MKQKEASEFRGHELEWSKHNPKIRTYINNNLRVVSSFSYYHWKVIEILTRGDLQLTEISKTILCELMNIILPNGETMIHRLIKYNIE